MPQPQTPSDSDSDEEGGGDFVFMDSVQSVFGALNPWKQTSQDENEIQVGALSQLDTAQGPSTDAPQGGNLFVLLLVVLVFVFGNIVVLTVSSVSSSSSSVLM